MKLRKPIYLAVLLSMTALAPSVLGLQVKVSKGNFQVDPGGEFAAVPSDGLEVYPNGYAATTKNQGVANSFQTFCLERSEILAYNVLYDVELSNSAKLGGIGGGGVADPISVGTAWLYDQFARGVLGMYDFLDTTDRKADAEILQQTIWYLEQEIAIGALTDTKYLDKVKTALATDDAGVKANATPGQFGVRVMNVTELVGGANRQDLLIRVPEGGLTIMLLGMSLLLIPCARRFVNQAS